MSSIRVFGSQLISLLRSQRPSRAPRREKRSRRRAWRARPRRCPRWPAVTDRSRDRVARRPARYRRRRRLGLSANFQVGANRDVIIGRSRRRCPRTAKRTGDPHPTIHHPASVPPSSAARICRSSTNPPTATTSSRRWACAPTSWATRPRPRRANRRWPTSGS